MAFVLHSAHFSKIFRRLMGTTCSLAWRNTGDTELVWTVNPSHPITAGVPQPIVINEHEMYGEFFDIPAPDELIFISTFSSGEVFRSGCCWRRGKGKVFYFSPGDQEYPVYLHPDIKRVLANAVQWARPETASTLPRPPSSADRSPISPGAPSSRAYAHEQLKVGLRAGVIGLGWAGQQHMVAYTDAADVDLVALAGLETEALQTFGMRTASLKSTATQTGGILLIMNSLIC